MKHADSVWCFVLAIALAGLAGCSKKDDDGEIMVFAAASLTDAFEAMKRDIEADHPDMRVVLNFAGSQSLRTQIQNGATPEVFASANAQHLDVLVDQGLADPPRHFAENVMVIAVRKGNPSGIQGLDDLRRAERLVLAGPEVPAGAYAEKILEKGNAELGESFSEAVMARVVSRETHVRIALQKVALGEADAAIVYATDAAAEPNVEIIEIPAELNIVAKYPVALVKGAAQPELGEVFVEHLLSQTGKDTLSEFGFRPTATPAK